MDKTTKLSNRDLFIQEVDKHWIALKNNEDTIFENIEIQLDTNAKFDQLRENDEHLYMELISESSIYEQKKIIGIYFWDRIVGDLYESTLDIMGQAKVLEEATKSFENSYKIEETARLILEKGIFARFPHKKKKELVENILEASFYPASFEEKKGLTVERILVEEGLVQILKNSAEFTGRLVTNIARTTKSLYILMAMLLISPATVLMSQFGKQGLDIVANKIDPGSISRGTSPSTRKFYSFLDNISPIKWIFSFLTKDQHDIFNYLKQANNLENEYVQDILKTAGGDSSKIVEKCWNQHKIQIQAKDRESSTMWEKFKHILSGKGLSNFVRDPKYTNENQLIAVLAQDASDPIYQKRFYDFRVCVYDKLFEIILGYAKAIYSMDDESYEVIKAANDAHKTKNFKAFFDLRPKQDNDAAMFAIMKALVAVDDVARTLEDAKGNLAADKYVDKFSQYLTQSVKMIYGELDEMANQKKYNEDRYADDDPDDDTKTAKIKEERLNAKRSMFE